MHGKVLLQAPFFMAQESWRSNIMIQDLISDHECSTLIETFANPFFYQDKGNFDVCQVEYLVLDENFTVTERQSGKLFPNAKGCGCKNCFFLSVLFTIMLLFLKIPHLWTAMVGTYENSYKV